jgi:hypothetical protein
VRVVRLVRVAGTGLALEDGGLGLLGLEEQRVAVVASQQQEDPGAGADAAHPHHLPRHVDEPELRQQMLPVRGQRAGVGAQQGLHLVEDPLRRLAREQLLDGDHERRHAEDAALAVHDVRELVQRVDAVPRPRLGQCRRGPLDLRRGELRAQPLEEGRDVELGVPDLEVGLPGEPAHGGAVGGRGGQRHPAALFGGEPVLPPGHGEAGQEPLDVPFPGPGERLVEVVDVEHHRPLRGGEDPEVRQVGVTTQLCAQAGDRGRREIRGHHRRRTPVERERRDQHAPVTDRHQLRHPRGILTRQDGDRIAPGVRIERRVQIQRHRLARLLPAPDTLRRTRQHRPGCRGLRDARGRRRHGTRALPAARASRCAGHQLTLSRHGRHDITRGA